VPALLDDLTNPATRVRLVKLGSSGGFAAQSPALQVLLLTLAVPAMISPRGGKHAKKGDALLADFQPSY
jgi:hypothetical protein